MSFEPSRLRFARALRGLTKKALSERSSVSLRTLTALESAVHPEPSSSTLDALATALAVPVQFLLAGEVELPAPESVTFRALKSLSASSRDRALAAATLGVQFSTWLAQRFELPAVSIPRLEELSPEEAAIALRAEWHLGNGPLGNSIQLLEAHGCRVFSLTEENRSLDAFSFWRDGTPFVFLNTVKSGERSRMDAAHELGHLVLHSNFTRSRARDLEFEARQFAAAFLLPATGIRGRHNRFPSLEDLISAKRPWAVSLSAYVYRLRALDEISEWHFRSLFSALSRLGFRTEEPEPIERETSTLLNLVLSLLREQSMTVAGIARALAIQRHDLEDLLFGLALLPIHVGPQGPTPQPAPEQRAPLRLIPGELR